MKIEIRHYRVPNVFSRGFHARRGKPQFLLRYGRGVGWLEIELELPDVIYTIDSSTLPHERGGKTVCEIIDDSDKENKLIAVGVAVCSMSDNFSYKRGRDIAYGRASHAAGDFAMLEEFTS